MRTLIALLVLVSLVAYPALAFEPGYLRKFVGKETRLTVRVNKQLTRTYLVLVDRVTTDGIIIGRSNDGVVHIKAENVVVIQEQKSGWHGVHRK